MDYYLVLAGGVGAAKFLEGLANVVDPSHIKIIVNTGDDLELFGLKICPDIDIITYTLAGLVDKQKGWGFQNDTFNCLNTLKRYYNQGWFNAGDKDLATHIYRTDLFRQGYNKTEITSQIAKNLGVKAQIIPMCNEDVQTYLDTDFGVIHFEEYYIKHQCKPKVKSIKYRGIENAKLPDKLLQYIAMAKKIIVCPSNPIVSIGTILSVPGILKSLKRVKEKIYGVSPLVQGATIKGPADKLMESLTLEVSCVGVAKYYKDFLGHFIIDLMDCERKKEVEDLGIRAYCFDTIMDSLIKKKNLAKFIIDL
ncbi:MAG: 2-phospho-L-lactate transferase [Promethearchaeota archaeon]|nr:MAG: 2-phospho-L-lactate transferase [Candidatus Lokiarchaeota archaeon]